MDTRTGHELTALELVSEWFVAWSDERVRVERDGGDFEAENTKASTMAIKFMRASRLARHSAFVRFGDQLAKYINPLELLDEEWKSQPSTDKEFFRSVVYATALPNIEVFQGLKEFVEKTYSVSEVEK